ncbi:hypothetical protein BGZ74_000858 [Mortierella antarctica]|nr:hypothetical protein BGZ74_000858 [Mortierella antarctica]
MSHQLADFDIMKKALMRDLQNRREKIVELEMTLDDTREQHSRRRAFLQRNLEQLTLIQKQLVEQNSVLKKEISISDRKLVARNERIQSLFETQLQAVREHLDQARSQKSASNSINLNFGRIAMPLRGGAPPPNTPMDENYSPSSLTKAGLVDRRTSWLGGWSNCA